MVWFWREKVERESPPFAKKAMLEEDGICDKVKIILIIKNNNNNNGSKNINNPHHDCITSPVLISSFTACNMQIACSHTLTTSLHSLVSIQFNSNSTQSNKQNNH